jgi:hypothetical protein
MKPIVDDLDDDLRTLLDAAAPGIEPPAEAKHRVSQRLAQVIGALPGSPPAAPRPAIGRSSTLARLAALRPIASAFIVGAVAGAGGYAALEKSAPERIVYIDRVLPAASAAAAAPVLAAPEPLAAASAEPRDAPRPRSSSSSAGAAAPKHVTDLEVERSLLDTARSALAAGRADDVFLAAAEHQRRFPDGILAEEREALVVNALVATVRYEEARERAERFVRRFPNSMLRPAVESAVESIPK